jgi:hypothetical protein
MGIFSSMRDRGIRLSMRLSQRAPRISYSKTRVRVARAKLAGPDGGLFDFATRWRTDGCASHEAKIDRCVQPQRKSMSGQYFYLRFKFSPEIGIRTVPIVKEHEAVAEVPKELVRLKQSELINENPREKANRPRFCGKSRSRYIFDRPRMGCLAV